MGIPGLTTFMNDKFTGWKVVNLKELNGIIIDGPNVCYTLFKYYHSWGTGGDYNKFRQTVENFFNFADFKNAIVVLEGGIFDDKRNALRCTRRDNCVKEMRDFQSTVPWDAMEQNSGGILPLLLIPVFMDVLEAQGIEYHVADGEADEDVAALANHHRYPVLGSDSDYFVTDLKYGLVHFERYINEKAAFYHLRDFVKQYSLKQAELCLIIPSIFNNERQQAYRRRTPEDYEKLLGVLKDYETCDQYLASKKALVSHEAFREVKKVYYDIHLQEYYRNGTLPSFQGLPEWVVSAFKAGRFPEQLLAIHQHKPNVLSRIVEAVQYDSVWKASQGIRQYLYGFMGLPSDRQVEEFFRKDKEPRIINQMVKAKQLKPAVSVRTKPFLDNNREKLSDVVLAVLKCHKISPEDITCYFDTLPDQWKLPIAATFYWYRILKDPRDKERLAKSLLLSFLICSREIPYGFYPLKMVTMETKESHLQALHAFSKWQCVYSDAMALNYVAREPFRTVSPSSLFSGQVAMHYAGIADSAMLDRTVRRTKKWDLYNELLYLITGCNEKGRRGEHFPQSKEKEDSSWEEVKRRK